MVSKSRLAAARTMATSSPINGIKDTALWLETSLDKGFNPSEDEDGATVTAWYDQQNSGTPKTSVVAVNGGPTYANTINRVHAVEFGKNGSTGYLKFDASFLNNTDYTIMILEKRKAAGANLFLKSIDGSNNDDNKLKLGYSNDNTVVHSQNNTSYTFDSQVVSYADSTDKPRLFTFVQSSTTGKRTYINGSLAAQDATNTAQLSGITSIGLGKDYTGEIVIFTRALKTEELQSVQDYGSKKWTRPNNSNSAPSCVNSTGIGNYTVTDSGCDLSSAPCAISEPGFSAASVAATSSAITAPCTADTANYGGSVTYTCTSGTLNVTGRCTPAAGCSAQTIVGATSQTTAIAHSASGSIACNASNYSGAALNYTCSNGSLTPAPSCANNCAAGYTGSTCSSCSSAGFDPAQSCTACLSGYDLVSGACLQKCTTPAATGITAGTLVPKTPVAQNCNASGYGGTFTYTCATAGGTATIATNSCVQQCTVSGLAGTLVTKVNLSTTSLACSDTANNFNGTTSTGSYSCTLVSGTPTFAVGTASCGCATGYTKVGSACQQNCTIPNGTYGILDGTIVNAGTTSRSCNATGASGTLTYTCDGTFTVTANNCVVPKCTGGNTSLYTVAGQTIHTFLASSNLNCTQAVTAQVLVVGGGGGGGQGSWDNGSNSCRGGGGGGGGVVYASSYDISTLNTNLPVSVGTGSGSANGVDSSFGTLTAKGGGRGGASSAGSSGGSGGGGAAFNAGGASNQTAQTNQTSHHGFSGSAGTYNTTGSGKSIGGCGGGAGGAATNPTLSNGNGCSGGAGTPDIITGRSGFYFAGGGGGTYWSAASVGGSGGGGRGGTYGSGSTGTNGTANTGGGGGGSCAGAPGSGGSGIVIIRYANQALSTQP